MADYQTIETGDTSERGLTLVARASGNPITSGTVNYYLKAKSGTNSGKWWRDSDQTWQASETANAMTHDADGHWSRTLAASPWADGVIYLEYAKESGDLHVPVSRRLKAGYTPSADSSRKVLLQPTQTGVTIPTVTAVTNDVGITQAGADKVWNTGTRTLSAFGFTVTVSTNNDKTGYSLSSAGVQAVWEYASRTLTGFGSLVSDIWANASRTLSDKTGFSLAGSERVKLDSSQPDYAPLKSSDYTAPDNSGIAAIASALAGLIAKFTGMTSLPNWLRALARKSTPDATAASEIGGTYDAPTDSLEGIRDRGDAAWVTGAGSDPETIRDTVWGNSSGVRNLTAPNNSTDDPPPAGTILIRQGDRWDHSIPGLGAIESSDQLYFTLKSAPDLDSDTDALAQISRTGGLLRINGAEASSSTWGEITITDADAGDITLTLWPAATALLSPSTGDLYYDVKIVRSANSDAATLESGTGTITSAVTRAVS